MKSLDVPPQEGQTAGEKNAQQPAQKSPPRPVSRREARRAAMSVVFSALTAGAAAADSAGGVGGIFGKGRERQALADALTQTIIRMFDERRGDITQWMADSYQRDLTRMTMVERAVIAAAVAEMLGCPDTPARVIINEAIELAKAFGAEGGGALVNGVLDRIASEQRGLSR